MALSFAGTPCRLGKRPCWRPWLEHRGNDDINEADRFEGEARKTPKTTIDELLTVQSSYELLFFNRGDCEGTDVLLITQKRLRDCPPAGYTSLARSESGLIFTSSPSLSQSSTNTASESMIAWWYIVDCMPLYCIYCIYIVCVVCQRCYCGILK